MSEPVQCGVDVLATSQFEPLRGQRVGLITNHTGTTRDLHPTVDLLAGASMVQLLKLFSPEHGIRGEVDAPVADATDAKTGLPIYSLYGTRTHPTSEQLQGLDTLVYDIQDVGTRYYTYISTLGLCMEAAAGSGIRFVVLDRPDPIGGVAIEGPIADSDRLDFTAYHTLPVRHGLTVGELARLFVAERKIGVELTVIPLRHWTRRQWWDETNLTWIHPSPNMRSLTQALLYPGIGLLEFTNVSVGRGTDTPFEVIGAPWIRERDLAASLNTRALPGVRFVPVRFTPQSSTHAGQSCGGINIIVTERPRFVPVLTGLTIAETLLRLFPTDWQVERYNRLLANVATYEALKSGAPTSALVASWKPGIDHFRERRKPFLLY